MLKTIVYILQLLSWTKTYKYWLSLLFWNSFYAFLMNITDRFKSYARYVYLFLRKSQHASLTDCKCRKLAPTNSDWTLLESISTLPLYAKFTNASRALKYSNSNTKTCNFLTFSQVKHDIKRNSFVYIYIEREIVKPYTTF